MHFFLGVISTRQGKSFKIPLNKQYEDKTSIMDLFSKKTINWFLKICFPNTQTHKKNNDYYGKPRQSTITQKKWKWRVQVEGSRTNRESVSRAMWRAWLMAVNRFTSFPSLGGFAASHKLEKTLSECETFLPNARSAMAICRLLDLRSNGDLDDPRGCIKDGSATGLRTVLLREKQFNIFLKAPNILPTAIANFGLRHEDYLWA